MSHSRSKGRRPQQQQRQQDQSREWNQSRNEQERYGDQSGYGGGGQGSYGGQGGYRAINYADRLGNTGGESEYQGSRDYRENPRYGQQQDWRSDWRSEESRWRPEQERDTEMEEMNRGRWEGGGWERGMESNREPERQRSNVTRFGQRREGQGQSGMQGMQSGMRGMQPGSQSGYSSGMMQGRQSFAGRGPQGYKRSDERIAEDINEELTQDFELDASDINVEIRNGEVILKGTVPDRESKRRAEEIAERCSGVKDVMNQLRVKRGEESGESENASRRDKEDKRNKVAS